MKNTFRILYILIFVFTLGSRVGTMAAIDKDIDNYQSTPLPNTKVIFDNALEV